MCRCHRHETLSDTDTPLAGEVYSVLYTCRALYCVLYCTVHTGAVPLYTLNKITPRNI